MKNLIYIPFITLVFLFSQCFAADRREINAETDSSTLNIDSSIFDSSDEDGGDAATQEKPERHFPIMEIRPSQSDLEKGNPDREAFVSDRPHIPVIDAQIEYSDLLRYSNLPEHEAGVENIYHRCPQCGGWHQGFFEYALHQSMVTGESIEKTYFCQVYARRYVVKYTIIDSSRNCGNRLYNCCEETCSSCKKTCSNCHCCFGRGNSPFGPPSPFSPPSPRSENECDTDRIVFCGCCALVSFIGGVLAFALSLPPEIRNK